VNKRKRTRQSVAMTSNVVVGDSASSDSQSLVPAIIDDETTGSPVDEVSHCGVPASSTMHGHVLGYQNTGLFSFLSFFIFSAI
jgi:hypothetical protein